MPASRKWTSADTSAAVDTFLAGLAHPQKPAVEALRRVILATDPSIADGIKWNAPSYRTSEYFATTHLRAKEGIGVVLHLGAKVRNGAPVTIGDPEGLLRWLAKDRAQVTFTGLEQVRTRAPAFQAVVRQWIRFVDSA